MARPPLSARPPTDAAEERTLRKLASARHAPASLIQRARIVTGSWDGASVAELAQRLGCHPKTVYKWLHRFNDAHGIGGVARPPPPGGGPRAPADPEAPAHWTLDALAATAQAEGIGIGRSQVRRILLAERVRWRRTRSWATSTDPDFAPKEPASSPSTPPRPATRSATSSCWLPSRRLTRPGPSW